MGCCMKDDWRVVYLSSVFALLPIHYQAHVIVVYVKNVCTISKPQ